MLLWNQQKHRSPYIASMVSLWYHFFLKSIFLLPFHINFFNFAEPQRWCCLVFLSFNGRATPFNYSNLGASRIWSNCKTKAFKSGSRLSNFIGWKVETWNSHIPLSNWWCTITLQDISLQLGLNIDGPPIVGPTMFDWRKCVTLIWVLHQLKENHLLVYKSN